MSIFSHVPGIKLPWSTFNMHPCRYLSTDFGKLTPIFCELMLPGDVLRLNLQQFIRTVPLIAPIFGKADVKVDFFDVPIRIIWDDFPEWITQSISGGFSASIPSISTSQTVSSGGLPLINSVFSYGSLSDHFGFRSFPATVGQAYSRKCNALPFRAYQSIWNEYYRNEDLEDEIKIIKSSGDVTLSSSPSYPERQYSNFFVRNHGWRKDYFTSALSSPQKGPSVSMPGVTNSISADGDMDFQITSVGSPYEGPTLIKETPTGNFTDSNNAPLHYASGLKIDSTSPLLEDLRFAETLQEYYEANARGGTRYTEHLRNIWHTRALDASLQRPQYLGGYRGPVTISEVPQTAVGASTPVGTLAGKAVSAGGRTIIRKYKFMEYSICIGAMSVVPKSAYFQGDRRQWMYRDAFDFPNPFFANLGEQPVWNGELYFQDSVSSDYGTFGYTPRYAEMKDIPDSVHGAFRIPQSAGGLDFWHMAREFNSLPNLNGNFVHMDKTEVDRIFPVSESSDKLLCELQYFISKKSHLPYYGVPRFAHTV